MLEAPTTSIYALNKGEEEETKLKKKEEADIEGATLDQTHINKRNVFANQQIQIWWILWGWASKMNTI